MYDYCQGTEKARKVLGGCHRLFEQLELENGYENNLYNFDFYPIKFPNTKFINIELLW